VFKLKGIKQIFLKDPHFFRCGSFSNLSSESIRVDRESITETSVAYRVIFRGQVTNVEIMKDDARMEIGEWLSGYIKNVGADLTKRL
jgi:hypothetical protein